MIGWLRKLLSGTPTSVTDVAYEPKDGDLVSVSTDEGDFGVMKILAVDQGGVHVRLYVERLQARPASRRDVPTLSIAPFGPGHNFPMSLGHVPLTHPSFHAWEPVRLGVEDVEEDELEGYRIWETAGGSGYFG